jgi:plasmid stability protein
MATLTIRELPEPVLRRLEQRARQNRRTVEEEARSILEAVSEDRADVLQQIEESWTRQSGTPTAEQVMDWIRQSRP